LCSFAFNNAVQRERAISFVACFRPTPDSLSARFAAAAGVSRVLEKHENNTPPSWREPAGVKRRRVSTRMR